LTWLLLLLRLVLLESDLLMLFSQTVVSLLVSMQRQLGQQSQQG
jgi:hypothetical protein